jgi:hypothetical protein
MTGGTRDNARPCRPAVQLAARPPRAPSARSAAAFKRRDLAIESADWLHSSLGDFSLSKQSMESWQDRRLAVCQTGTCRDGDGSKTSEQANPFG